MLGFLQFTGGVLMLLVGQLANVFHDRTCRLDGFSRLLDRSVREPRGIGGPDTVGQCIDSIIYLPADEFGIIRGPSEGRKFVPVLRRLPFGSRGRKCLRLRDYGDARTLTGIIRLRELHPNDEAGSSFRRGWNRGRFRQTGYPRCEGCAGGSLFQHRGKSHAVLLWNQGGFSRRGYSATDSLNHRDRDGTYRHAHR